MVSHIMSFSREISDLFITAMLIFWMVNYFNTIDLFMIHWRIFIRPSSNGAYYGNTKGRLAQVRALT